MTLGLTGGLAWSGNIISLSEPPQDNLVGHWDFTDYTQLSGALTGSFGSYLSGTDPIGRCKNKAPNVDGSATPKLGQWVKAIDNSKRPIFKTGGANGNTYAEFDNSSTTQALACRSTNTTWGAHGTDNLSSTRLTAENLSIFIVGEPLDDDTDGVLENVTFTSDVATAELEHEIETKKIEIDRLNTELNKTQGEKQKIERVASHSEEFELKEKAMDNILKLVSMQDMTKLSRD